uniref:MYND-type domain-containing protein n=1 Tax=Hemiselmis andersenii TaxID=464988 RepID=A0A6U4NML3_HEMAN|mmetsp:Transcript_9344/g.21837  ORF Transcript_9344/g.21837 Transcript_9344/m.21837 type:complete len:385 (-) Transcript_9344:484-1638(-)
MESCYRCHRPTGIGAENDCACKNAFYCSAKCKTAHAKVHAPVCTVELRKQIDLARKKFGPESCDAADAIARLAEVYDDHDKVHAAETGYVDALRIFGEHKKQERKIALIQSKKANILLRAGRPEEALEDAKQSCKLLTAYHGGDSAKHQDIASCFIIEGEALGALTRYQEALEKLEKAYEMLKGLFGETHELVAGALGSIASVLVSKGKKTSAVKIYEKAIAIQRKTMGEARVGASLLNLGRLYVETGEHEKGMIKLQEGLNIAKSTCGSKSLVTGKFLVNIGWAHTEMGHYNAAHDSLEAAVDLLKGVKGEDHEDVADALYHLSICEMGMKDTFGAKSHVKEAHDILERRKGGEGCDDVKFERVSSASERVCALMEQLEGESG